MSGRKRSGGRDLAKEALWRGRMASQRESGLSVRAYCRDEGLGEAAFHWWRRELALRDREPGVVNRRGGQAITGAAHGAFVEVSCVGASHGDSPGSMPVEVVLRGGRVIRVAEGFSTETVSRLVALLEGNPC